MPQTLEELRAKCGMRRVRVTQEIIDRCEAHKRTDPDFFHIRHCPVAQALNESIGGEWMTSQLSAFEKTSNNMLAIDKMPPIVRKIVFAFDDGNSVAPAEFDVEVTLRGDD